MKVVKIGNRKSKERRVRISKAVFLLFDNDLMPNAIIKQIISRVYKNYLKYSIEKSLSITKKVASLKGNNVTFYKMHVLIHWQ